MFTETLRTYQGTYEMKVQNVGNKKKLYLFSEKNILEYEKVWDQRNLLF